MTCDDAFERMTDGGLREDGALSEHLAECPRCRAMYETLAPAIGAFQSERDRQSQSVAVATQSRSSTEYAVAAARRLTQQNLVRARIAVAARRARVCAAAASLLLGVAVSAALLGFADQQARSQSQDPMCTWQSRRDGQRAGRPPAVVITACIACHVQKEDPARSTIRELEIDRLQGRTSTPKPDLPATALRLLESPWAITVASPARSGSEPVRCFG